MGNTVGLFVDLAAIYPTYGLDEVVSLFRPHVIFALFLKIRFKNQALKKLTIQFIAISYFPMLFGSDGSGRSMNHG